MQVLFVAETKAVMAVALGVFFLFGPLGRSFAEPGFDPEIHDSWRPPRGSKPLEYPGVSDEGREKGRQRDQVEDQFTPRPPRAKGKVRDRESVEDVAAESRRVLEAFRDHVEAEQTRNHTWTKRVSGWITLAAGALLLTRGGSPSLSNPRLALSLALPAAMEKRSEFKLRAHAPDLAVWEPKSWPAQETEKRYRRLTLKPALSAEDFLRQAVLEARSMGEPSIDFLLVRDVLGQVLIATVLEEREAEWAEEVEVLACLLSWEAPVIVELRPGLCETLPEPLYNALDDLSAAFEARKMPELRGPVSRWTM